MERILVIGCPGRGKTRLAKLLGEKLNVPVLADDSGLEIDYLKQIYLSSDNKIVSLADVWNCGGEPRIFALDDCGKVYYVDYEEYNEAKMIDLNLNQKVINLAIFNDTTPFTTCGGDTIYVELEDHKYYRLNDYLSDKPFIGDVRE